MKHSGQAIGASKLMQVRERLGLRRPARAWLLYILTMFLSSAAAFATVVASWQAQQTWRRALSELDALSAAVPPPAIAPTRAQSTDFTQTWTDTLRGDQIVRHLQAACSGASVVLVSAQLVESPSTVDTLGRIDLRAILRGSYPATKKALGQLLKQHPALTVQVARWSGGAGIGREPELSLNLAFWRPALLATQQKGGQLAP